MKCGLLTLVVVALPLAIDAKPLTGARFLASARNDYQLRNSRELTAYFENAERSTPYVDKVELRTETDRFEILRQKYSLRIYLKGWGETSYSRQLAQETVRYNHLTDRAVFNAAKRQRAELLLDHLEATELLQLQRRLLAVYQDRVTVLRKQSQTVANFNVASLIAADNELIDQRLALVRLADRVTRNEHRIASMVGGPAVIAFSRKDLLPMTEIAKLARTVKAQGNVDNTYLQRRRQRIKLADLKYRLEVARSRDYVSFFKVEFDTADHDRPERAFSVGFALKMPWINPDRDQANRRKAGWLEQKLRLEQERRATSERIVSLSRSLRRLLAQQQILLDRKSLSDAEASFKRYLAIQGINPLTLLKLKESIIKGDIRLTEIDNAIRKRHVALLDVLGRLGEGPLRKPSSAAGEVLR